MNRIAVLSVAAVIVVVGAAIGVYSLRQPEPSGKADLWRGPADTTSPLAEAVKFTPYPTLTPTEEEQKDFRARLAKLAIKRLAEYYGADKDKNVVFSPVCSMSTLGMLLPAASGSTEQVILDELCMAGCTPEWVLNNFREYFSELKKLDKDITQGSEQARKQSENGGKYADEPRSVAEERWKHMGLFRVANAVWTTSSLPAEASYGRDLASYLSGEAFSTELNDSTRGLLDEWVARKSSGLIRSAGVDSIPPATVAIAVSAAMFCSQWADSGPEPYFPIKATKERAFATRSNGPKTCPFMGRADYWSYQEGPDFRAVLIPYTLKGTEMVVILPSKEAGIEGLLQQLSETGVGSILDGFGREYGVVRMPKFDYRCEYERNPFIPDPNGLSLGRLFARVSKRFPLSLAKQVAEISVNEEGTKALAVEVAIMIGSLRGKEKTDFVLTLERPFVFFIMGPDSEVPLFAGIVNDPTDKGKK